MKSQNAQEDQSKPWGGVLYREGISDPPPWLCPKHLWPVVCAIAKRQQTSPEVILAQAVSDYCHRGT
jgi:hypothetical protein